VREVAVEVEVDALFGEGTHRVRVDSDRTARDDRVDLPVGLGQAA
jgi:hypothetical protein